MKKKTNSALASQKRGIKVLLRNNKSNYQLLLTLTGVVFVWRLGLEAINQVIAPSMIATGAPVLANIHHGLSRWFMWDGYWYYLISDKGYIVQHALKGPEAMAFSPGFPVLIKWLAFLTHLPFYYLGLLINVLLLILTCLYLFKLTQLWMDREKVIMLGLPYMAVTILLLNPSSFFFAAYYADSLLTLAFTASIYYAFKKQPVQAGLFAAVATATKSIGVALIPAILLIMYLESGRPPVTYIKEKWQLLILICFVGISGLLAYMTYLYYRFHDALLFLSIQKYWPHKFSSSFLNNLWQIYYKHILHPKYYDTRLGYLYHLFTMAIPISVLLISIYIIVKYRWKFSWLALMMFLVILMPLSTGTILSVNRYALVLTPLISFFCVYIYASSRKARFATFPVLYLSAVLMFVFTVAFLSFRFVG